MAQYPYNTVLYLVQHGVLLKLNLGKLSIWLLPGEGGTNEVPNRQQIFGIRGLKIAISDLLEWIPKGLSAWETDVRVL